MLCISVISWCYVRETEGLTFYLSMSFEAVPVSRFRSAKVERKAKGKQEKRRENALFTVRSSGFENRT